MKASVRSGDWIMERIAVACLLVLAAPAYAAESLRVSTCSMELAVAAEVCRERAAVALEQRQFGKPRRTDYGWTGASVREAVAIQCFETDKRALANIVIASAHDGHTECLALQGALAGDATLPRSTHSRHLEVSPQPDGTVLVLWHDTPGNSADWIAVEPAGASDSSYGTFWSHTGERGGRLVTHSLPSGVYEARLYFNWSTGGYVVQDRVRFEVGPR